MAEKIDLFVNFVAGTFFGVSFAVMLVNYVGDYGPRRLAAMKEACELNLPRSQKCRPVFVVDHNRQESP